MLLLTIFPLQLYFLKSVVIVRVEAVGVSCPDPLSAHCSPACWQLLRENISHSLPKGFLSLVCRVCPDPTHGRLESQCPGSTLTKWQRKVEDKCLIFLTPQVDKSEAGSTPAPESPAWLSPSCPGNLLTTHPEHPLDSLSHSTSPSQMGEPMEYFPRKLEESKLNHISRFFEYAPVHGRHHQNSNDYLVVYH